MPMRSSEIDAASGAGANGGRRPTVVPAPDTANAEFSAQPRRRTFIAADKLRILADVDRAASAGGIGAVLRREGLYSSTLSDWRRLRDTGAFGALTPARRGPKIDETNPLTAKVIQLQKDNARPQESVTAQPTFS